MSSIGVGQAVRVRSWVGRLLVMAPTLTLLGVASPAAAQNYGQSVAAANFNSTQQSFDQTSERAELVISAPWDDWGAGDAGNITVYWRNGSQWSFDWIDQQRLGGTLFSGANDGGLEAGDLFGWSMVTADFDGDGFQDLAVSAPYEDLSGLQDAGCVHVLYGAAAGPNGMPFRTATTLVRRVSSLGVPAPEAHDQFGFSLAAGDFNRDGKDDLVVGAPGTIINGQQHAGAVHIFISAGTTFPANQRTMWYYGHPNLGVGVAEAGDGFGASVAVGNLNGDRDSAGRAYVDLAIGVPGQDLIGAADAGEVLVLTRGTGSAFFINPLQITQGVFSPETAEPGDQFGVSLAVGNFNRNSSLPGRFIDDLAIGVPFETVSGQVNAGTVHVVYGSTSGMNFGSAQTWLPSSFGGSNVAPQAEAYFGWSLHAADVIQFPNGGCGQQACNPLDLVIGERGRNVGSTVGAGRIYLLQGIGGTIGLVAIHSGTTEFNRINRVDGTVANGQFGYALASGQIKLGSGDPGPISDVFVGAPGANRAHIYLGAVTTGSQPSLMEAMPWPW